MRDINRIDPFLKELRKIWLKFPDLRFGQLIENLDLHTFLYYIEDDDFIEILKYLYEEN